MSSVGVIPYNFLVFKQSVTAEVCRQQLDVMHIREVKRETVQSRFMTIPGYILQEWHCRSLGYETFIDLSLTGYHFFKNLDCD